MKLTVTAKIKILPSPEQKELMCQTLHAYRLASQFVSKLVFDEKVLNQQKLHFLTYRKLRADFQLSLPNGAIGDENSHCPL